MSQSTLEIMLHLLEKLPIPLMLQTGTGQVLAQNYAWRQQLGSLTALMGLHQDVATLLEQPSSVVATASSHCQLGATPETCTCVCSRQDGQECVWQFTRIPLGSLTPLGENAAHSALSDWIITRVGEPLIQPTVPSSAVSAESLPFRLAPLQPNISDPDNPDLLATSSLNSQEMLWLVSAQDRTEQHQFAEELEARNADLVQLNRLKDEFLACISHELKSPLTAVVGLSSLLKDQLLGSLNERQSRYAQLIYQSGRRLMKVVNDILDLTRIETGQLDLNLEPVNIRQICDRALEGIEQQFLPRQIQDEGEKTDSWSLEEKHFKIEIEPGLETLMADEFRLRQMLINLLSNAIKFTRPGDALGLRVTRWPPWIAFTIWDTGIGIPEAQQPLIFQKFQQLEQPLTRQYEGTGLGLVLTQRLARLHGGEVTFISNNGQGSEFTLLLPAGDSTSLLQEGEPLIAQRSGEGQTILIAEAVPHYLESLYAQLKHLNYQVIIARSGVEALEKARRLRPAALFLNPLLSGLSGWDILTLLKANPSTQKIPVVILATTPDMKQNALQQVEGVLRLPAELSALQQILAHVLVYPLPAKVTAQPHRDLTLLSFMEVKLPGSSVDTGTVNEPLPNPLTMALSHLMHAHHWRILEVDDLEQAELLARIWKPQAILMGSMESIDLAAALQFLRCSHWLSRLPLITLTAEISAAAQQIEELAVFPYVQSQDHLSPSAVLIRQDLLNLIQAATTRPKRRRKQTAQSVDG
jgi:signal transduction histidine kinase/CheY-like chemotaxis protein